MKKEERTTQNVTNEVISRLSVLAEKGDTEAQVELGICYYSGEGVEQDYEKAEMWLRKAAEQGDALALYNLGELYYETLFCVDAEQFGCRSRKALDSFRLAAEKGNVNAMFRIGNCYGLGYGTHQNIEEASKWFRKAAELGHVLAQRSVAIESGICGKTEEAVRWYRLAAGQGDEFSQHELECYRSRGIICD